MKKLLKWSAISILVLCLLVVAALLVIPMFVDIEDYKPRMEAMVSEQTGRQFRIGGGLELSLFPWAGIAFSDLTLGNPEGYDEKNFVAIRSFDVKVKLLPLLSRNVEVKRFVIEGPTITLEKSAAGEGNWEGLGGPPGEKTEAAPARPSGEALEGFPIKSLQVGECAVKEGTVLWIDHATGERKTLSDLDVILQDVCWTNP